MRINLGLIYIGLVYTFIVAIETNENGRNNRDIDCETKGRSDRRKQLFATLLE